MPLVRLADVSHRFGNGTLALDRLSLEVAAGEFLALLGPSGCGKSTLLRIIAGLVAPTGGSVEWGERPPAARGTHPVGFVFQEPTLMPWSTVFENVYLPLRLKSLDRAEARARVDGALASVGLADFASAYPRELSGGMKMRASIARALVAEPRVLLMDEPFAALDEITRARLNDDLLALWRRTGITVVFVTHSVYESVYLAGRVVVMRPAPGRVVADLAIDEPYPRDERYRTSGRYGDRCREVSRSLREGGAPVATGGGADGR